MKHIIKKLFKGMLIYGLIVNFLYGLTDNQVKNMTNLADWAEAKGKGNKTTKLTFSFTSVWKKIFKNLTEMKNQIVRYWRAW